MANILFRQSLTEEAEFLEAKKHSNIFEFRNECPVNSLVVGRYSVLPYYNELVKDLQFKGSRLINSHEQHRWIADFSYYQDLKDYTFESWEEHEFPYMNYEGPFVVKGKTNSRKHEWNKKMFAPTRQDAIKIAIELMSDPLISEQGVIYRKYEKLKTFEIGFNGLPFCNEWRFFFYKNNIVDYGYYWSIAEDITSPSINEEGMKFVQKVADIASEFANFFCLDVAEKEDGDWVLVEVNDGQMAGLSTIPYERFYYNLERLVPNE